MLQRCLEINVYLEGGRRQDFREACDNLRDVLKEVNSENIAVRASGLYDLEKALDDIAEICPDGCIEYQATYRKIKEQTLPKIISSLDKGEEPDKEEMTELKRRAGCFLVYCYGRVTNQIS